MYNKTQDDPSHAVNSALPPTQLSAVTSKKCLDSVTSEVYKQMNGHVQPRYASSSAK